ncbi:hypothetical protein BKA81DRAFT_224670 [Phyllosticta paracitricarpa]|uniref:Secreted protein n=2 Tax=Phyllosticta TaxID=121621 RepID=A0ABR1MJK2_9PEZI
MHSCVGVLAFSLLLLYHLRFLCTLSVCLSLARFCNCKGERPRMVLHRERTLSILFAIAFTKTLSLLAGWITKCVPSSSCLSAVRDDGEWSLPTPCPLPIACRVRSCCGDGSGSQRGPLL